MRRAALRLALAACALGAPAALAHPDIAIESRVAFLFAGDRIAAIEESWTFDAAYSKTLLAEIGAQPEGGLSAAQSRALGEATMPNLEELRYFTYLWLDGRDLGTLPPRDFAARLSGGRVTFIFRVDLPAPVDPRRQALKLEIADRDYYAAFRLAPRDPVALREAQGVACTPRIRDDVGNAYFGFVYPQEITLSCR